MLIIFLTYLSRGLALSSCISCRSSFKVEWRLANSLLTLDPAPLEATHTEWSTLNDKRCISNKPETPTRHPAPTAAHRLHLARKCSRNCCSEILESFYKKEFANWKNKHFAKIFGYKKEINYLLGMTWCSNHFLTSLNFVCIGWWFQGCRCKVEGCGRCNGFYRLNNEEIEQISNSW